MHGATNRALLALIFSATWAALACAPGPMTGGTELSPQTSLGRVLVAPLNLAVRAAPELESAMEPTYRALLEHLQHEDRQLAVIDGRDASVLWNEVMSERTEVEAEAGQAVRNAASRFAQRLAEEQSYRMLVFPALLMRRASVDGFQVTWDGVRHPLPEWARRDTSVLSLGEWGDVTGYHGAMPAGSLHVAILAPDGALLHEGIGGIGVLQQVFRGQHFGEPQWILSPGSGAFQDAARVVREGVERAFAQPLRRSARAW